MLIWGSTSIPYGTSISCILRAMAAFIALRRHAWLQSTNLQPNIKAKVEDLPFDGEGLFHKATDDILAVENNGHKRAKNVGVT